APLGRDAARLSRSVSQPDTRTRDIMSTADFDSDPYYQAVTAIDAGDVDRLQLLLAAHPQLVSDRLDDSPEWLRRQLGGAVDGFFSRPYLLWFVAEDPVRNGRLPSNMPEIIHAIVAAARQTHAATLQEQLDSTLRARLLVGRCGGVRLSTRDD